MLKASIALAAVAAFAPLEAQRPDFTGTWVRQDSVAGRSTAATGDASFRTGDMGSGWGTPLTLTQTADKLSVVFDFFIPYDLQPKARYAYALNGSESTNTVNVGHTPVSVESFAMWKGDTLEIASRFTVPPGVPAPSSRADLVQRLWIDAQGRLMVEARRQDAGALVNSVRTTWARR